MTQQILLAITFVYGPLYLITKLTIFKVSIIGFFDSLNPSKNTIRLFNYLDTLIFYFSLCYQSWYWLFKTI